MVHYCIARKKEMFDSHCHLVPKNYSPIQYFQNTDKPSKLPLTLIPSYVVGTSPNDWQQVVNLIHSSNSQDSKLINGGIGIHPWYIQYLNTYKTESLIHILKETLLKYPILQIGEIGLDKSIIKKLPKEKRNISYTLQKNIFELQLSLGVLLNRKVSIHCVRAFGDLLNILIKTKQLPPKILLHSYSGNIEITKQLIKIPDIFFSFSSKINLYSCEKCLSILPKNRILVESDLSIYSSREKSLENIIEVLEKNKKITKEQLNKNFIEFTNLHRLNG
eukprot:maker-scaffold_71-snap-gene-0.4-mRNA-1 protein AED:0.00 eAED:0.00 QI:7/1/1/1/1/1/2/74/275